MFAILNYYIDCEELVHVYYPFNYNKPQKGRREYMNIPLHLHIYINYMNFGKLEDETHKGK